MKRFCFPQSGRQTSHHSPMNSLANSHKPSQPKRFTNEFASPLFTYPILPYPTLPYGLTHPFVRYQPAAAATGAVSPDGWSCSSRTWKVFCCTCLNLGPPSLGRGCSSMTDLGSSLSRSSVWPRFWTSPSLVDETASLYLFYRIYVFIYFCGRQNVGGKWHF